MSKNTNYMDARQKTIANILIDNEKLVIPVFQRNYSWKEENWKELWIDIKNGYNEDRPHYMGSVVLVENNDSKEIVDGQQRITTLTLLYLAIIKNFLLLIDNNIRSKDNLERVNNIKNNIIYKRDLYNLNKVKNKLILNDVNNTIYENYIVPDKLNDVSDNIEESNLKLIKCYQYFTEQIKKECIKDESKYPNEKYLLDYYEYISSKVIFIEITAKDYSSAYTIFETLNDRGLDLTVTDLLKNYIFSMLDNDDHKNAQLLWSKICTNVGEKNVNKFLRHFWNSYNRKVTERELFRAIKKSFEWYDKEKRKIKVNEFIKRLSEVSEIYGAISEPNNIIWGNNDKLREYLYDIKLYKVDLCYPVILATQLHITSTRLKQKIFRLCSRISFRHIIISEGSANDLEVAYNNLCIKICNQKDNLNFEEVIKENSKFIVSKEQFILAFKNKVVKTKNNKKLIMHILNGIEKNKGGRDNSLYTIEHILPEDYKSNNWDNIFNNECSQYVYRLGNYTLLEKELNSEIGNKRFEEKIKAYNKSEALMTLELKTLRNWDIETLEKRQEDMANIANTVWGL